MVLVLRSWWVTGLCVSTETSTFPYILCSGEASDTGLPELPTAVRSPNVPWGAAKSQTLSAVQPEGALSLASRVLSLL